MMALPARRRLSESEIELLSKERPYVLFMLQTQMLYDIAGMMEEAAERLASIEALLAKPRGYAHPINVTVEGPIVLDFIRGPPYTPLFAVTIFNDGPDEVYPSVNEHQRKTPLMPRENVRFEYTSARIERIYLDVDSGKRASIRGFGVY
jgi:hypothetical protein